MSTSWMATTATLPPYPSNLFRSRSRRTPKERNERLASTLLWSAVRSGAGAEGGAGGCGGGRARVSREVGGE